LLSQLADVLFVDAEKVLEGLTPRIFQLTLNASDMQIVLVR